MPYEFEVDKWCVLKDDIESVNAFNKLCEISLELGYTATYWIPKYVAKLDLYGKYTGEFVSGYLNTGKDIDVRTLIKLAYLASQYPYDSDAWMNIATPICEKATEMSLNRIDREKIYFGLSKKETGLIEYKNGEIPDLYKDTFNVTERLFSSEPEHSPLKECRKWFLDSAIAELKRETARAEEDIDHD
jgi:hypothetical protein